MRKIALVFGGNGGIGQAICSTLRENGLTVYHTYYQSIKGSQNPYALCCDITSYSQVKKVIHFILKKEGTIDIVINSVTPPLKLKLIEDLFSYEFKQDIGTILLGGINIARTIIPVMKSRHQGIIIYLLSKLVIDDVSARMSSYISAKYGLLGFTKCLALELKQSNILVFGISPSFVKTTLLNAFPKKMIEMERNKRRGGLISPEEVAKVVSDIIHHPEKYNSGENIQLR